MADSNETVTIATGAGAPGSTLLGIGAYRPERVVSNEEICETIDSTSEWIYERSGILNRRFASADESIVMMSTEAARKAVASAGIDPELVDAVILCTSTNWTQVPHAAPQVATNLGRNGIAAFDLTAGCAGFGYGLAVATNMIRGGASPVAVPRCTRPRSACAQRSDAGPSSVLCGSPEGAAPRSRPVRSGSTSSAPPRRGLRRGAGRASDRSTRCANDTGDPASGR